jgi:hypothetical protein
MSRYNIGDVFGGVILIAAGLWFSVTAHDYSIGTLLDMGPGYFPRVTGILTIVIGLAIILTARPATEPLAISWRAFGAISASIAIFGLMLVPLGLVPAVFAATCAAAWATPQARVGGTLVLASILACIMSLVFIYALGIPLSAIRGLV